MTDRDAIRAHVRDHLRTQTREAIISALVEAGHDREAVEDVWEQEWTGVTHRTAAQGLGRFAMALFLTGAVFGALGALAATSLVRTAGARPFLFFVAYAAGYILVGLAIWLLVRWGVRRLNLGGLWVPLVGILLVPVYGALMLGGCLAAASLMGTG